MFKNYQELFEGCVDFYSATLFGPPAAEVDAHQQQLGAAHTTRGPLAGGRPDAAAVGRNWSSVSGVGGDGGGREHTQDWDGHKWAPAGQSSALEQRLEWGLARLESYLKPSDAGSAISNYKRALEPDLGSRLAQADGSGEITIGSFNRVQVSDALHVACFFLALILAKRWLVLALARNRWLERARLRPKDRERLDECVWRLAFYSFSSAWLIYTCFVRQNSWRLLFSGASTAQQQQQQQQQQATTTTTTTDSTLVRYSFEVDWWSYTICMIETAFYVHATYALVWEDVWRRDSPMMLVHHLAAIFSLYSVYATRLHQIGLATTVLRDTCDVLLEVTKLLKCLYIQRGRRVAPLGLAIKFSLGVFTLAFAVNQLYYYPLFCLYHGLNLVKVHKLQTPVMAGIVTCGLVFLLLDCLWFLLILRLLYYIVLSGGKLRDIREYEDDDNEQVEEEAAAALYGEGAALTSGRESAARADWKKTKHAERAAADTARPKRE